jgi:hypothetical protein
MYFDTGISPLIVNYQSKPGIEIYLIVLRSWLHVTRVHKLICSLPKKDFWMQRIGIWLCAHRQKQVLVCRIFFYYISSVKLLNLPFPVGCMSVPVQHRWALSSISVMNDIGLKFSAISDIRHLNF